MKIEFPTTEPNSEQAALLEQLFHETAVLTGLGMRPDDRDFLNMDSRRIIEATEMARDIAQVRIAGLIALLETHGADITR